MRSVRAASVTWLLLSLAAGLTGPAAWAQGPALAEDETSEPTVEAANEATNPTPGPQGYALLQAAHKLTLLPADQVDYDQVIKMCEDGLSVQLPEDQAQYGRSLLAWALNRAGEAKAVKGDEAGAFADFQRAISLKPDSWRALHNRAVNFAVAGKTEEALDDFNKTIELNPNYANAFFNRGELHYDQGRYAHAIEDYNKALALTANDSSALNSRGHAYYQLGRYRDALTDYSRALRADPRNASALTNRADAYADMGDFGRAAADYREAIRLDPKLGRAYLGAAWLMATCPDRRFRSNPAFAVESARKAVELEGDKDFRNLDVLAATLANDNKFAEAVAAQTKAVELAGTSEDATRLKQRLELYQKNQPYRSPTGPRTNTSARFSRSQ
ncbi:MAG: tetratricopeptide repeat protein [Pirellulales bacterium]